jgi:Carboxypeptidase regulatory-like domain
MTTRAFRIAAYVSLLSLSLLSMTAIAQSNQAQSNQAKTGPASIHGVVSNPAGGMAKNVTVQAKNVDTGAVAKATSSPNGEYKFVGLSAGKYDVSVTIPGIKGFLQKNVAVDASKPLELNIKLEEGTQLSTLGEDPLGIEADRKRHAAPSGPTPRTVDGKPDFSGVWWSPVNTDPGKPEWLPGAEGIAKQRMDINGKESPQAHCLPSPATRLGPLFEFAQTKSFIVVISDDESPGFHQVYIDGRTAPKDLDTDLWYGTSIGHWEDDTLVIDRVGFNERVWLDQAAHPHSDKLHIIERDKRPDLGHLEQEITVDDPGVLAKPWTFKRVAELAAKESIREFICAENNRDEVHLVGK